MNFDLLPFPPFIKIIEICIAERRLRQFKATSEKPHLGKPKYHREFLMALSEHMDTVQEAGWKQQM